MGDASTTPETVGNATVENRTTGEYKIVDTVNNPHVSKVSGSVDGKAFTAVFTATCSSGGDLGLDQTSTIGNASASNIFSTAGSGPITFKFTGFENDADSDGTSDSGVSFVGFTEIAALNTNRLGLTYEINGIKTQINTTTIEMDISSGNSAETSVSFKHLNGAFFTKQIALKFTDIVQGATE